MSKKHKSKKVFNDVDIVIPVYSNYPLVEACVKRIPEACENYSHRIFLIDDASPDYEKVGKEFYKKYSAVDNVRILYHKDNKGFGQNINAGCQLGSARYIVILSTDVFLHKNAIDILVGQLAANEDIGITAPKLLFPPNTNDATRPAGKIQHAGISFDITGKPFHNFIGWDDQHPFANRVRDVNAVTGACIAVKRDVWFKIKGFDPAYGRGYYEDIDACVRVRMMGLKIRYLPQAVGYHLANASMNLVNGNPDMEKNYQYFKLKLGSVIPFDEPLFSGL